MTLDPKKPVRSRSSGRNRYPPTSRGSALGEGLTCGYRCSMNCSCETPSNRGTEKRCPAMVVHANPLPSPGTLCTNTAPQRAIRPETRPGEKRSGRQAESRELPVPRVGSGPTDLWWRAEKGRIHQRWQQQPARHSSLFLRTSLGWFHTTYFPRCTGKHRGERSQKWRWPSVFYPACYFLGSLPAALPGLDSVQPRWSAHCLTFAASAAAAFGSGAAPFPESLGLRALALSARYPQRPLLSPLEVAAILPTFPSWPLANLQHRGATPAASEPKWSFWGFSNPINCLDSNLLLPYLGLFRPRVQHHRVLRRSEAGWFISLGVTYPPLMNSAVEIRKRV